MESPPPPLPSGNTTNNDTIAIITNETDAIDAITNMTANMADSVDKDGGVIPIPNDLESESEISSSTIATSDSPSFAPSSVSSSNETVMSTVPSATPSAINIDNTDIIITTSSNVPSTSISSVPSTSPTVKPTAIISTPPPTYAALPIQPINIVVLTDIHSWVMGHKDQDEQLDADFGDILGFYQRLKNMVYAYNLNDSATPGNNKPDLYFVMNGDFIHGTYLGTDPPRFLSGILEQMPFDIVSLGDHEVRDADSLALLRQPGGLFDEWGDRLITSNIRVKAATNNADDMVPLGSNYKILRGNQGTVLVLGFLYDMGTDEAVVTVEKVKEVMEQSWFTSLLSTKADSPEFDILLVMAHMDVQDELISTIHSTLRQYVGSDMPIQFITGHTHTRAYEQLDEFSSSFQAGRYLDTVGFVSFHPNVEDSMEHVFINANRKSLAQSLGKPTKDHASDNDEGIYPSTKDGMELSQFIQRTMDHSGANEIVGCSSSRYRASGYANETDSLLHLYLEHVLPTSPYLQTKKSTTSHHHSSSQIGNIFVQYVDESSGSVQYDLFEGAVTMNDIYGVVPVDDTIVKIGTSIRGDNVLKIIQQMKESSINATDSDVVAVAVQSESDPASSQEVTSTSSMLLPPYGIKNETSYALHTLSKNAAKMQHVMIKLDVPAKSTTSNSHMTNTPSMRGLWMDFVKRQWPYDGNNCQCLQEDDGCHQSGIDYNNPSYPTSAPGISGGSGSGSSTEGNDVTGTESTPTVEDHGGGKTHVGATPSSKKGNGQHHSPKNRSNDAHNLAVFWVAIFAAAVFLFAAVKFRRRRDSDTITIRRSEFEGRNNDLELQESTAAAGAAYGASAGGYASPAMTTRGTYV